MNSNEILISDFVYDLPDDRIAKYPLAKRDESKLLVFNAINIQEDRYKNLSHYLPENSLLVFNNTKVVEARLFFEKNTGGKIEIFCLEPDDRYNDITSAMLEKGRVEWKCLIGGAKKWKEEKIFFRKEYEGRIVEVVAQKKEKLNDYFIIEFNWNNEELTFAEILHIAGEIPLPPYLNRQAEEADKSTYQTVYAKHDGSVAAPTAGLHFTSKIFSSLAEKKINTDYITLHVGAGTFKPVKVENVQEHEMHYEFIDVTTEFIEHLLTTISNNYKVIAVGTTSLRTLESLYWIGVKIIEYRRKGLEYHLLADGIKQWECYEFPQDITAADSLLHLISFLKNNNQQRLVTKTQIIITPGYQFKIIDGLITNFHQPKSTLLLLIAALIGDDWRRVYDYALQNNFRFLSYGDGSLLWKKLQ